MKKILVLSLFILFYFFSFSQKLGQIIRYSNDFNTIKNLSYLEFKDKCSQGWSACGVKLPYLFSDPYSLNKLVLDFKNILEKKNVEFANKYEEIINDIATKNRIDWTSSKLDIDFEKGTENAYQYVQMQLQKIEIVSEYYKSLYNYQIDKENEDREINLVSSKIKDSINNIKKIDTTLFKFQRELTLLKRTKENTQNQYTSETEKKIRTLDSLRNQKIKNLKPAKYIENKNRINKEYDSLIFKLQKNLDEKNRNNEAFWKDKIIESENKLKIASENFETSYEDKISIEQETKTNAIKKRNNLQTIRTEIENLYIKSISNIDEKLNTLIKNN